MTLLGAVGDWMTRDPVAVGEDAPVGQVLGLMRARDIRHVLVMQGSRLVGVFSSRDAHRLLEADRSGSVPVGSVMTENPVTVAPDASLLEAAREILDRKIGALPVTEEGRPIGILTSQDVLEALVTWAEQRAA